MSLLNPERSLGFQVRRCHRRFDRLLNARLSNHDLKTGFWYYLRALWVEDDVTQKHLSDVTNVTETTTVSMITRMIQQGLVSRSRDKVDKRKMRIKLTDRGRDLEGELMKYAVETNRIALEGIPPEEIEICSSVLARMSQNLQVAFDQTVEKNQKGGSELID